MLQNLDVKNLLKRQGKSDGQFLTQVELEDGERVRVNIPLDAKVASSEEDRWKFSDPAQTHWRWSAGGAVAVVRLRDITVMPFSVSDATLPVWPGHLKAPTSISRSTDEWMRPIRLMQEAFRAVVIATPMGLALPSFDNPELDELAFGAVPSLLYQTGREAKLPGIFHSGLFDIATAKLIPLKGEREVVVAVDGTDCSKSRALVVLDPETRGIDLMHAYEMDLKTHMLDEVSFFYTKELSGRAENSEVALLELDSNRKPVGVIRSYQSGLVINGIADMKKLSPVVEKTLAAL